MIDLKNKLIFVHIPKTAGTAIESYFLQARGLDHKNRAALGIFTNSNKASNLERGNQHCSLSMIEQYYFGGEIPEDFRIFTVVRCPYKRFWSEWSSRKLPPPMRFPFSFHLSTKTLIDLTRREIAVLKDLNSHMRPQCQYLTGQAEDRVRILRFENLAADFSAMQRDWALPDMPLPRENMSKRSGKPTAKDLALGDGFVAEYYADDFSKFGYDLK
jgi:hypothetical protein